MADSEWEVADQGAVSRRRWCYPPLDGDGDTPRRRRRSSNGNWLSAYRSPRQYGELTRESPLSALVERWLENLEESAAPRWALVKEAWLMTPWTIT